MGWFALLPGEGGGGSYTAIGRLRRRSISAGTQAACLWVVSELVRVGLVRLESPRKRARVVGCGMGRRG